MLKGILKQISGFRSRIGLKLVVPYALSSFVVFLIISGFIYENYQSYIASAKTVQEEIVARSKAEVNFYLQNILQEISLAKKNTVCLRCTDENGKNTLRILMFGNPSIYNLSVVDESGVEVYKLSKYENEGATIVESKETLKAKHDLNKEVLKQISFGQEKYLSPVYISEYGLPSITIGMPIKSLENKILGVVLVGVDLSPLWNTVSRIKVGETGYVYIVDKEGRLVSYKDINLVKQRSELKNITEIRKTLKSSGVSSIYTSFTGEQVIGTLNSAQLVDWDIIVELPYWEVLNKMIPLLIFVIISFIIFAFFIVYVLHLVYKSVLDPLGLLEKGVLEIESGKLGETIQLDSQDEIGDLAKSFSEMSQNLKKSREGIEKAYEIEKKARNVLEIAGKAKTEFVSIAAHQLRTPLTVVRWMISGMIDTSETVPIAPEHRQELDKIMLTTKHLIEIVNDLLNVAMIEDEKFGYSFDKINIVEIIKKIVQEVPLVEKDKHLECSFENIGNAPIFIYGDVIKLQIALRNVIQNAIDYSYDKGKIIITMEQKDRHAIIVVRDFGVGILQEDREHLFTKFYRSEQAKKMETDRSGLGLYIVKSILEKHHGDITLFSEIGVGTTVKITLPCLVER
jgi:signal transduction histidine kinase